MVLNVTDESLNDVLESKLVVLQFTAPWCGPCRMVAPVIEEFANDNPDVKVGKIVVDENQKSAASFGVRSIPAVMFFKDGKLIDKVLGANPKTKYQEMLNSIK